MHQVITLSKTMSNTQDEEDQPHSDSDVSEIEDKSESETENKETNESRALETNESRTLETEESRTMETSKSRKTKLNESDDEYTPSFKRQRFEAQSEETQFDWELPQELKEYAEKYFYKFISEKDLKESVLKQNPVPGNLKKPGKLDDYFSEMLEKRKKKRDLSLDHIFERLQTKIQQIMGPLCKAWFRIEEKIADPSVGLDPNELSQYIEQTVMLSGQASNAIAYNRRLNALTAIGTENLKAKNVLKEQAKLFENPSNELFGKPFRNHMKDTAKAKKESKEIYDKRQKRPFSVDNKYQNKRPFPRGPSSSFSRKRGYEGRSYNNNNNSSRFNPEEKRQNGGFNQRGWGKKSSTQENGFLRQHGKNTRVFTRNSTNASTKMCAPNDFKTFPKPKNWEFSTSRKGKTFPSKLENNYKQPRSFKFGFRARNKVFKSPISNESATSNKNVKRTNMFGESRGENHVRERSHSEGQTFKRSVSKQSVSSVKERWRKQTGHQFKKSEYIYPIPSLQNGRFALTQRPVEREGLYVQSRFEGRLLLHSPPFELSKIYPFSMGRPTVRISLSGIWSGTGPSNFYKDFENSHSSFAENQYKTYHIPRRCTLDGPNYQGVRNGQRHPYLSLSTVGSCHKSKKICIDPNTKDRVSRNRNRHIDDVPHFTKGQSYEYQNEMSEINSEPSNNIRGNSKSDRVFVLNSSSSFTSISSDKIFTTPTYSGNEAQYKTPNKYASQQRFYPRIGMVGQKLGTFKWQINSDPQHHDNYTDRCINEGLGCLLPKQNDRGSVDLSGKLFTHKCVGVEGNKASITNICKDFRDEESTLPNRQYDCSDLSSENGRNKKQGDGNHSKRDLGICHFQGDHDYSRIFTGTTEYQSRLDLQTFRELQRMDAPSVPGNL